MLPRPDDPILPTANPLDADPCLAERSLLALHPQLRDLFDVAPRPEQQALFAQVERTGANTALAPLAEVLLAEVTPDGRLSPERLGSELPLAALVVRLGALGRWQDAARFARRWASRRMDFHFDDLPVHAAVETAAHLGVSFAERQRRNLREAKLWAGSAATVAELEEGPGVGLALDARAETLRRRRRERRALRGGLHRFAEEAGAAAAWFGRATQRKPTSG